MNTQRFTPENITKLSEHEIFVFGSNLNGRHAGGAARLAVEKFGAKEGVAEGLQGQSYAIPTLDRNMNKLQPEEITRSLVRLSDFAKINPEKIFYLTRIGCGIAGFDTSDIIKLVRGCDFPDNVIAPQEFIKADIICIRRKWSGEVLFEYADMDNTILKTLLRAMKYGADLYGADLYGANLCGADLCGANLYGVNLCGADLYGADLYGAKGCYLRCPSTGSFIGWKKADGYIVKLIIPENALRSSSTGDKCRCNKAYVEEIQNIDGTVANIKTVHSSRDHSFVYTTGVTVEVPDFDENRWNECAPGIHFFVDRRAAVEY